MNILTFDIEEWYAYKELGKFEEYDFYLEKILDKLDERGIKGTFFCVGAMATEFPYVVKKIDERGHEIGCHSMRHTWLNKMSREETMYDTRCAVDALEQCVGKKIQSYRAPAFSIGKENKWAFEILYECGIRRDASIFPAERDFGGFSNFGEKEPSVVYCNHCALKEFPICTTILLGHEVAYSGGGYFRFFPLSFVRNEMAKCDYSMTYFHIADLIPERNGVISRRVYEEYFKEPGTLKARYLRYIKSNLGKKGAFNKLMKLIDTTDFVNIEQADNLIDWEKVPSVLL